MPTDPTTAEKAAALNLTKCPNGEACPFCAGKGWLNGNGIVVAFDDERLGELHAERFPKPVTPAPDYRAALEALVDALTIYREWHPPHGPGDGQDDALYFALTHARKVLHGQ